jgi:hypothetical protein
MTLSRDADSLAGDVGAGQPVVVLAGTRGAGDYRCLSCGYGVVTFGIVPECPMCHGLEWKLARRSPFSHRERRLPAEPEAPAS